VGIRVPLKQHPDDGCDCIETYMENQVKYLQCPLVQRNSIVAVHLRISVPPLLEAVEIDISIDGYFHWRCINRNRR
jgi:hypothetical protein